MADGSPDGIKDGFLGHYVERLAAGDTGAVASLFMDDAMLSFDGNNVGGRGAIGEFVGSRLGASPVRSHHSKSVAHPTGGDTGALLVFWTGTQEHAGSELRMSEVFTLLPVPTGGIVVRNNIFRSGPGVRPMNSDAEIAHTFITNYYSLFDDNAGEARAAALSPIYRPDSALQFEDDARIGMEAIVEKLQSLPALRHKIVTLDFQPFNDKACVIFVNGEILIEGETNPMLFAQCFFLVAVEGAAFPFYVANDIFQFNYA